MVGDTMADPASLIGDAWTSLMQIKRRFFLLRAFEAELIAKTGGAPFDINGDAVWMVMLDSRDVLVIHLASWCKALTSKGGLLGNIKAHHFPRLRAKRRASGDPLADNLSAPYRAAAFDRLFPGKKPSGLQHSDLDALRDSFAEQTSDLLADRSDNRAHPWEASGRGTTAMLEFTEIGVVFGLAECVLNDLGLILTDTTWGESVMLTADPVRTAADLVGLVLQGSDRQDD